LGAKRSDVYQEILHNLLERQDGEVDNVEDIRLVRPLWVQALLDYLFAGNTCQHLGPFLGVMMFHLHQKMLNNLLARPFFCRDGLVFKAHRLLYHSNLDLRVIKKKKKKRKARFDLGFAAVTLPAERFVVQLCDAVAVLWGGVRFSVLGCRFQGLGFRV